MKKSITGNLMLTVWINSCRERSITVYDSAREQALPADMDYVAPVSAEMSYVF